VQERRTRTNRFPGAGNCRLCDFQSPTPIAASSRFAAATPIAAPSAAPLAMPNPTPLVYGFISLFSHHSTRCVRRYSVRLSAVSALRFFLRFASSTSGVLGELSRLRTLAQTLRQRHTRKLSNQRGNLRRHLGDVCVILFIPEASPFPVDSDG